MIDPYDYNQPEDGEFLGWRTYPFKPRKEYEEEYDCLDREEDLTDDDENEESEDETIRLAIDHRKRNH